VVLRDIFLDGNTFARSHSVDKEYLVGNAAFGIGIIIYRFKISIAEVIRSKEFRLQNGGQKFGSITLSFTY
jgi:lipid A 3-O-deacylase